MSRLEKEIERLKSKPHPKNILKSYQIKEFIENLKEWRMI